MLVTLVYFKLNGKYYGEAEYESENKALYQIWADVDQMLSLRQLPGLVEGHGAYIVYVGVPDHQHNHPHLILPRELEDRQNALSG